MDNLAYKEPPVTERIEGRTFLMSPRPRVDHTLVSANIYHIFRQYLKGKTCKAFPDGVEVHLDNENVYVPDGMIVCDRQKIHRKGIFGAPDLVVEILSPATANNDRGVKLRHYAAAGVKEYWVVSPLEKTVEVYHSHDGLLELDCVYTQIDEEDLADLDEKERADIHTVIHVSLYDDLDIHVDDIFDDIHVYVD